MRRLVIGSLLVFIAFRAQLPRRLLNFPAQCKARSLERQIDSEEQQLQNLDFQISARSEFAGQVSASTPSPPPMCGGRPMIVIDDGGAQKQEFLNKMSREISDLRREKQELEDRLNAHRESLAAAKREIGN